MDVQRVLAAMGGVARFSDLAAQGVSQHRIEAAVRWGLVERASRGVYALPFADRDVVTARAFRAQIGCVSACAHWGLPLWDPLTRTHLVVPSNRSPSRRAPEQLARVALHRTGAATGVDGWCPPLAAVDQSAWCSSPVGQLMIVDAALHAGLVRTADLHCLGEGTVRRRAWLRRLASGAAESPLETLTRFLLGAAGLRFVEQVEFANVGRVDFQVEESLVVEADGWLYHSDRDAFETDRRRDQLLLEAGLRTVRLTSRQLRANPMGVAASIARLAGREPDARLETRIRWALRGPGRPDHAGLGGATHRQQHVG